MKFLDRRVLVLFRRLSSFLIEFLVNRGDKVLRIVVRLILFRLVIKGLVLDRRDLSCLMVFFVNSVLVLFRRVIKFLIEFFVRIGDKVLIILVRLILLILLMSGLVFDKSDLIFLILFFDNRFLVLLSSLIRFLMEFLVRRGDNVLRIF